MIRQIHYTIEACDKDKSIGVFLREKEYSRAVIIELKKTPRGIRKNGSWAGVHEVLKTGDELELYLEEQVTSENIVGTNDPLEILYEDEDLLIVSKPHDMPIHPSVNNYDNTLANAVKGYYEKQNMNIIFRCINRLDRDTTGVTIIAKNMLSASILSKRMKEQKLSRRYLAFAEGITPKKGTINKPIGRAEGSIIKREVNEAEGKEAITHYERLLVFEVEGQPVSVVALQLETGRTHQIRVHMTAIGNPLLGDFLYNETNHMLTRQALHGRACCFNHPLTGETMEITAPLPQDMAKLLEENLQEGLLKQII